MHLVAPKVTVVTPVTIGFPSSNPFANGPILIFVTISTIIPTTKDVASSLTIPSTLVPSSL